MIFRKQSNSGFNWIASNQSVLKTLNVQTMKSLVYIIPILLVSLLSSTASYGQGKDSVKTAVDDLVILGECCIRQTGLEKDTATMAFENRKCEDLNKNYERQICNLEEQQQNSDIANINLERGLRLCKEDLKTARRKNKGLKLGMFTLPPIALAGGLWLGFKLGK